MRDLALGAAGVLAIVVALFHGAIAELYVFPKAEIQPRGTRRLLRLIWQASTIDWIAIGILLIGAPWFGSQVARNWIIAVAVAVYSFAAVGNAVAVRRPHPGWILMSFVVVLALVGM